MQFPPFPDTDISQVCYIPFIKTVASLKPIDRQIEISFPFLDFFNCATLGFFTHQWLTPMDLYRWVDPSITQQYMSTTYADCGVVT